MLNFKNFSTKRPGLGLGIGPKPKFLSLKNSLVAPGPFEPIFKNLNQISWYFIAFSLFRDIVSITGTLLPGTLSGYSFHIFSATRQILDPKMSLDRTHHDLITCLWSNSLELNDYKTWVRVLILISIYLFFDKFYIQNRQN